MYQEMLILRCVLRCIYADTLSIYFFNEHVWWKVRVANVVDNIRIGYVGLSMCDIIHKMIVKEGR